MKRSSRKGATRFALASMLVIGLGVGWLIGLSVSPVVSTVLTTVLGSAAAIVAALCGVDWRQSPVDSAAGATVASDGPARWQIDPVPLALLVTGIVIGSMCGLFVRNHQFFGSDVSAEVSQWTNQGIAKEEVVRRLFDNEFPAGPSSHEPAGLDARFGSFLFAVGAEECASLRAEALMATDNDTGTLVSALRSSTTEGISKLPEIVSEPETLRRVILEVLCVNG